MIPPPALSAPTEAKAKRDLRRALEDFERELVRAALAEAGGRRSEAARLLGIPERTLSYRMKMLALLEG